MAFHKMGHALPSGHFPKKYEAYSSLQIERILLNSERRLFQLSICKKFGDLADTHLMEIYAENGDLVENG